MESDSILLFLSILVVVVAGFVALILWGIFKILYQTSGIERLAERFRAGSEPAGVRFGNQTISIGSMRFRHCAWAVVCPAGLYLKPWLVVPAMLIPWSEIRSRRETRIYRQPAVELTVGEPVAGRISVFPDLFAALRPYLG